MATTILIVCPECGKQIKAPDNVIGKRVRCKFCQAAFVASKEAGKAAKPPAGKSAKPPAGKPAKPSKPAVDEDEDDSNPYGLTEVSLSPRCPDCANEIDEDQIVCLHCGYNTRTREKPKLVKTYHNTAGDQFMWLLPGIICVLVIIGVIIFDIWYLMKINDLVGGDDSWYLTMWASGGIKLWVVITSLFILFFTGKFAIKRLIIHYAKPEVEKLK